MHTRAFVLLLVFGLLAAGEVWAQEPSNARGQVTGRIITADTEEPLEGATVTARNPADSSLVSGTVTDSTGAFVIDGLSFDTYTLRVSFVGFATKRITDVRLTRARPERELGTITLAQRTAQLDEVTVSAERPAVDIQTDRTVYNTNTQLVTAGGSARTVLQDLPSIQVDIDGSISYRGNEGVVVHINGEPTSLSGQSLASFLQSLPASSVESVEVIPNPSAKYEPEGAAGIINIILKENRAAGWSGAPLPLPRSRSLSRKPPLAAPTSSSTRRCRIRTGSFGWRLIPSAAGCRSTIRWPSTWRTGRASATRCGSATC